MKTRFPLNFHGGSEDRRGSAARLRTDLQAERGARLRRLVCAWLVALGMVARAADTNSPAMTPQDYFEGGTHTYRNWVELSTGGFLTHGNRSQAQEIQHWNDGAFGGIEDLRLKGNVSTNVVGTLDGHSIFDAHDYDVRLRLERPEKWYLQFYANNFRTWSDDMGGFYPPTGTAYSKPGAMPALDRGEIGFKGGLTLKKMPALTFSYTHRYRDGDKNSTIWGPVHPDPLNSPATVQGLFPSFYDIDETVDAFDVSAKHHIKATDLGLGLHYEHGALNDALDSTRFQGEPVQRDVTDRQKTTYDLFSVNATSETWIKNNLMFSAGGMFANLDNDFSGSRIYGDDFDVGYSPNPINGLGYYGLNGGSGLQEYVMDINLLALPTRTWTITPAIRAQKESWDAHTTGTGTFSDGSLGDATGPFRGESSRDVIDVTESLDVRYTGITNWVFSVRGQWDQGDGSLRQAGGIGPTNTFYPFGVPQVNSESDDQRFFQKYSFNARWYPLRWLVLDAGYYYKQNRYNYNFPVDSTPNDAASSDRYPGYLTMQQFATHDGNLRLTLHPLSKVTLTSRYEYQLSDIHTAPDPASGLSEAESSRMTSHILAQDISWTPWSRLGLQAGFNYVLSETKTPVSGYIPAGDSAAPVLPSQNDYWTVNFSSCLVIDNKTDLNLGYFYYQADDYQNNSSAGVPLGTGTREHGVSAMLTRWINPHTRLNLKYGYYNYADVLTGGHSDFTAHLVSASVQYRF